MSYPGDRRGLLRVEAALVDGCGRVGGRWSMPACARIALYSRARAGRPSAEAHKGTLHQVKWSARR